MTDIWTERLAEGVRGMSGSAIRDLLAVTERPEVISFAGGLPAPECFPNEELTDAATRILTEQPLAALQYGPSEGYRPLREFIVEHSRKLGMPVGLAQVLITGGSQQALDLLGKLMIDPGAPVAIEAPTYVGALQAWNPYRPHYVSLPVDDDGLDIAALERLLAGKTRPRFLYVVSSFQNPTGVTLSVERRQRLIELAARFRLPIIEDDPYGELAYDGPRSTTLAAMDIAHNGGLRNVVYLSTFSKLLAPGLRVGWVLAPSELSDRLVQARQGMDLHTGGLSQATAYEACRDGLLDRHVHTIRAIYRERRDVMLAALEREMPAGVSWTRPTGGMFIWLTMPSRIDAVDVLRAAIERDVAFVPGRAFYPDANGFNSMRLNFSHPAPERINAGIQRLAAAIRQVGGEEPGN